MPRYCPITPLSMAMPLITWTDAHGRWPTARECSAGEGLRCVKSYYRYFEVSTLSAIMEQAYAVVSQTPTVFVVQAPPSPGRKPCLGCRKAILDQRAHIRFCRACRQAMGRKEREHWTDMEVTLTPYRVHFQGVAWSWDEDDLMEVL